MRIGTHSIAMKINNLPQTVMCVLQIRRLKANSGFKWWIIIVGVVSGVLVVGVILWLVFGSTFHKSHEHPINMAYQTHAAQNYGTDCYQGQQDLLIAANTQPAEWQHSDPYNRPDATGEYRPNPMNHLPYSLGVRPTPAYNRNRTDGVTQRASPMLSQHTIRDSSPPAAAFATYGQSGQPPPTYGPAGQMPLPPSETNQFSPRVSPNQSYDQQ